MGIVDLGAAAGFTPGTDGPYMDGIRDGTIAARATPGNGLYYFAGESGLFEYWVRGVKATRAAGNTANMPAAPTNYRIDVLQSNDTWISGASATTMSGVSFPALSLTTPPLAAVFRRGASAVVKNEIDTTPNCTLFYLNHVTGEHFFAHSENQQNMTQNGVYGICPTSEMPIYSTSGRSGMLHVSCALGPPGLTNTLGRIMVDNVSFQLNALPISAYNAKGAGSDVEGLGYNSPIHLSAGSHQFYAQFQGNASSFSVYYVNVDLWIPK